MERNLNADEKSALFFKFEIEYAHRRKMSMDLEKSHVKDLERIWYRQDDKEEDQAAFSEFLEGLKSFHEEIKEKDQTRTPSSQNTQQYNEYLDAAHGTDRLSHENKENENAKYYQDDRYLHVQRAEAAANRAQVAAVKAEVSISK